MSSDPGIHILDVDGEGTIELLPPCADPGFDHRSCDYWEDEVRGSKAARSSWLDVTSPPPKPKPKRRSDNPFAPPPSGEPGFNPFDPASTTSPDASINPFAPTPDPADEDVAHDAPRKLRLLDRGRTVFGSYAKVLLLDGVPAAFAQFGPLSAYPRAQQLRELYPALPSSPLPAVITCISTTPESRGRGLAAQLVVAVLDDLASRGFAAVETYPDLTLDVEQASAATPRFWESCGFTLAAEDDRFPVMRCELG